MFTTSMIVCKHFDFINIDRHKYTHMKWNSCSWALRLHLGLSSIQYLIIMIPTIVFYSGSIEAPLFSLRNNRAEFLLIHRIGIVSINKIVSSHHDGLLMTYSKRSFICWAINNEGERERNYEEKRTKRRLMRKRGYAATKWEWNKICEYERSLVLYARCANFSKNTAVAIVQCTYNIHFFPSS